MEPQSPGGKITFLRAYSPERERLPFDTAQLGVHQMDVL
jgi:hypothetical protein